jgi:hypothetical protein
MNTHVAPVHWSYSSLKNFEGCPQRYYQEKEIGAVRQLPNKHTDYGLKLHEAVENFFSRAPRLLIPRIRVTWCWRCCACRANSSATTCPCARI